MKQDKKIEQNTVDALINEGKKIVIKKRSLLKYIGSKYRQFTIYRLYGRTLLYVSKLSIGLEFDEDELQKDPLGASKRFVASDAMDVYRILSYAILNSKTKIKLFGELFAKYLSTHLESAETLKIAVDILELSDYQSFLNTIRLMKGLNIARHKKDLSPMEAGG